MFTRLMFTNDVYDVSRHAGARPLIGMTEWVGRVRLLALTSAGPYGERCGVVLPPPAAHLYDNHFDDTPAWQQALAARLSNA